VYVKPECGLCGPLWAIVERAREELEFEAEKIDISKDPELTRKYGLEVPVVLINGKKAFKGSMTAAAFQKRLQRASAHGPELHPSEPAEETPFIPAPGIVVAFLALAVGGAGFFLYEGVSAAELGRGRLAASLFKVENATRDRALDFDLETFDGKKLSLDDYRGKVLFINFWATWCPPCIEEMPSLERFEAKMSADPRFAMVAVSADEGWQPVRKYYEAKKPPVTVLLDASGKLAKEYGTEKFPETYVVIDGKIVGYIIGPRDWDTWYAEAYARELLDHGDFRKAEYKLDL
jgi:thiol-disulfide isomerase/thioredoxin